jgi:hypothetical protein
MLKNIFILLLTTNVLATTITPIKTNMPTNPDQKKIITIGFYDNKECKKTPKAIRKIYLQDCFFWQRKTHNNSYRDNSINNLQCFKDRLCYTQYPESNNCKIAKNGIFAHKQFSTTCTKEAQGTAWAKIISGSEFCQPTPKDFQCPQ